MTYYQDTEQIRAGARSTAAEVREFLARGGGAMLTSTGYSDVSRALGHLITLGGEA